jgi:hypothetical protein
MASRRHEYWNDVGIVLAVLAGLTTFAFASWPIAPPLGRSDMGVAWGIAAWIVGFGFIAAGFLVDRHVTVAKTVLAVGALFLVGSALVSAEVLRRPALSWLAVALDLVPVALGLAASALLRPVSLSHDEWALRPAELAPAQSRDLDRAA